MVVIKCVDSLSSLQGVLTLCWLLYEYIHSNIIQIVKILSQKSVYDINGFKDLLKEMTGLLKKKPRSPC